MFSKNRARLHKGYIVINIIVIYSLSPNYFRKNQLQQLQQLRSTETKRIGSRPYSNCFCYLLVQQHPH